MIPRFFGAAHAPLYGVYHPPAADAPARRAGVVLCYPGPQEYRQAHWAYRRLAALLAAQGVPVLRFDYHGTGDSAGASEDGSLTRWAGDVATAAEELRDAAGVRRVSLVGMRLGAAAAARACAAGLAVADLVLWDPVVRGADYLAALAAEHAVACGLRQYPGSDRTGPDELLGYVVTPAMRAELEALDLAAEGCGRPGRALVVAADDGAGYDASGYDALGYDALGDALRAHGVAAEVRRVPDVTLARGGHATSDTLLARHVPAAVAEFLAAGR